TIITIATTQFPSLSLHDALPICGLSWLPVLSTTSFLSGVTLSQAQPLPNRVSAALVNASLNLSSPPSWLSMALARSPCGVPPPRSEEHTSELQSRENLVCRLLLE